MTSAQEIAWDDTVLPFQLDRADMRGRVVRLDKSLVEMLKLHDYPEIVREAVADAVLLTALIGQSIKLRWKLSLQVRGDGPIRLIATDYFGPSEDGEPAKMRAYASYDKERVAELSGRPFPHFGKGYFAVLIDQGSGMQPYQGITPLAGASLADCAETYFAQSEQIPTRFALASAEATAPGGETSIRAGGVIIQQMPKASPFATSGEGGSGEGGLLAAEDLMDEDDSEKWTRVTTLLSTVELTELLGPHVTPDQLILRLFHEEAPRVYDAQPVQFGCTCGPDKVRQSLSIYSAKDIAHMTKEDGTVTADCQFCGAHYSFDPSELGFESAPEGGA